MHSFHFTRPLLVSFFLFLFTVASFLTTPTTSAVDTLVFGGCSQLKYTPGTPFESNLNSLLTSLVNSAYFTLFTNFTVQLAGLFQCRGDLSNSNCYRCVSRAVAHNDHEIEKTLAILTVVIAAVALLVAFLSSWRKVPEAYTRALERILRLLEPQGSSCSCSL